MATLRMRQGGYKAGLAVYILGMLLFIIGFSTPNWCDYELTAVTSESQNVKLTGHAGLWKSCYKIYGVSICEDLSGQSWELIVRGLEGGAMAILVLTFLFGLYLNLMQKTMPTLSQEVVFLVGAGFVAGLCISGVATYATHIDRDTDLIQEANRQGQVSFNFHYNLSWAFGLNIAGGVLMIPAGIILRVFSKPSAAYLQQQQQQQQQQQPGLSTLSTAGMPMGVAGPAPGGVQVVNYPTYPQAMYSAPPPDYTYYSTLGPVDQAVYTGAPMAGYKQ